ncbi:MAG: hypothetical protein VW829_18890 [Deltaproteobacteria bacterium]
MKRLALICLSMSLLLSLLACADGDTRNHYYFCSDNLSKNCTEIEMSDNNTFYPPSPISFIQQLEDSPADSGSLRR